MGLIGCVTCPVCAGAAAACSIADSTDFLQMDALSAAVPMKVDLNPQLTLMASTILRTHAVCVCDDFGTAKAHATFRRLVHTGTEVEIPDTDIVVKLGHRANNPLLIAAGCATGSSPPLGSTAAATSSASSDQRVQPRNDAEDAM